MYPARKMYISLIVNYILPPMPLQQVNHTSVSNPALNELRRAYMKRLQKRTKRATHRVFIRLPMSLDIRPVMTELIRPFCA